MGFTLQIYFDFSGYSDMALGIGLNVWFSLPENFQYPYLADSISSLLASMAYNPRTVVPELSLHPSRRKPVRADTIDSESYDCLVTYWSMAWSILEFCTMGLLLRVPVSL